jgi:hypothetical protein
MQGKCRTPEPYILYSCLLKVVFISFAINGSNKNITNNSNIDINIKRLSLFCISNVLVLILVSWIYKKS